MSKNYGTRLGTVLVQRSDYPQYPELFDVLYKDENVLILRVWDNMPKPRYFLVSRVLGKGRWTIASQYMKTINTGGIPVELLSSIPALVIDFDAIVSTYRTNEQIKAWIERIKNQ